MKKALITGITGQDGSYLAELLLSKGYEVHGIKRRSSSYNTSRIDHIHEDLFHENKKIFLYYGDVTDGVSLSQIIGKVQPDEIYNLAAQSHVKVSFEKPEYTANADALGPLKILEAIRVHGLEKKTKFYQASTSEMYGGVGYNMPPTGYTEESPFHPRSPYGVAKLYAHWITINYRESYGLFACSGILFNHESPRRGETFVTRKITMAIAAIHLGMQEKLFIGNLDAQRDRGHAKDYVEAMRLMLQNDTAEDFVIATGTTMSVREFLELAFKEVGVHIRREGTGVNEKGFDMATGKEIIVVSDKYFRPSEVELLLGDATKAKKELGRMPNYTMDEMIKEMINHDITYYKRQKLLLDNGFTIWQN